MPAAAHWLQTPKCAFLLPPTIIQLPGTKLGTAISVLEVTPAYISVGSAQQGGSCRAGLQLKWLPSIKHLERRAALHPDLLCACLGLLLPVLWTQWQGALAPVMISDNSAVFFILSGIWKRWPGKEQIYLVLAESDKELLRVFIRVLLLRLFWFCVVGHCCFLF